MKKGEKLLSVQNYEKLLQIDTDGWRTDLKKSKHHHRYEPTPYEALDALFWEYDLSKEDTVVDFGSGKGRVPFYIHSRFENVVKGVEMSETLHKEALQNKLTFRQKVRRGKGNIRFKQVLAEQYPIKLEDTHFYFFNPFTVHNFKQVVANIIQSSIDYPRKTDIILYYPTLDYIRFLETSTPFRAEYDIEIPKLTEEDEHQRFLIYRVTEEKWASIRSSNKQKNQLKIS